MTFTASIASTRHHARACIGSTLWKAVETLNLTHRLVMQSSAKSGHTVTRPLLTGDSGRDDEPRVTVSVEDEHDACSVEHARVAWWID